MFKFGIIFALTISFFSVEAVYAQARDVARQAAWQTYYRATPCAIQHRINPVLSVGRVFGNLINRNVMGSYKAPRNSANNYIPSQPSNVGNPIIIGAQPAPVYVESGSGASNNAYVSGFKPAENNSNPFINSPTTYENYVGLP